MRSITICSVLVYVAAEAVDFARNERRLVPALWRGVNCFAASCAILEVLARWLVDAKNVIDIREFESLGFCAAIFGDSISRYWSFVMGVKRGRILLIAVAMFSLISFESSEAQLFRRPLFQRQASICNGPACVPTTSQSIQVVDDCPPLVVQSNLSPDELKDFEPVSETNAQWFRSAARMIAGNSCGSGSVVGFMDESTLLITNAHVVGTRPGSAATVRMMVNGEEKQYTGTIVMAAYSDKVLADWAIVRVPGKIPVEPRKLSKEKPEGDHVTVGSPRCVWPLVYSALKTVDASNNSALWRWTPNAIGGQSGSGVWSAEDGNQDGLLTWSWGGYGAGQQTWWIYQQAKQRNIVGELRPAGLAELSPRSKDVIVEEGFFVQANIGELPIWAEDSTDPVDPVDPTDPPVCPAISPENAKKLKEALKLIEQILQTAG